MKFIADRRYYLSNIICFALCLILVTIDVLVLGDYIRDIFWFLMFLTLFFKNIKCNSVVTINENGITATVFGIKRGVIAWEKVKEAGIMAIGYRKKRHYLYFSTRPLNQYQRNRKVKAWIDLDQDDSGIYVDYKKDVLDYAKQFYHGEFVDILKIEADR